MTEEAYRLAKEVGEFSNLMRCYNNLPALVGDYASDFAKAETVLREGRELAQRAGAKSHQGWITGSLGDVAFKLGRLEESESFQREAVELAVAVGDEPLRGMRLIGLAAALLFRGRLEDAQAVLEEAIPIVRANPEPQADLYVPMFQGHLALVRGDPATAADRFSQTVELLRAFNVDAEPSAFVDLVRALQRAGRAGQAETYRDLSEHGSSPAARANATLVEGLLAESPVEAHRLLADGVGSLEGLGLRIDAARGMVDAGRAMARVGEDPRETFQRARDILVGCGANAFLFELPDASATLDRGSD
jgi:tetratricopeptide (TPR) repeat protein